MQCNPSQGRCQVDMRQCNTLHRVLQGCHQNSTPVWSQSSRLLLVTFQHSDSCVLGEHWQACNSVACSTAYADMAAMHRLCSRISTVTLARSDSRLTRVGSVVMYNWGLWEDQLVQQQLLIFSYKGHPGQLQSTHGVAHLTVNCHHLLNLASVLTYMQHLAPVRLQWEMSRPQQLLCRAVM